MSYTSDIHELLQKFRQTLLAQLQAAAQVDRHHYQVVGISDIQFKFPDIPNKVQYYLTLQIHPEALIEAHTMRFFLAQLLRRVNLELQEYKAADARWGKNGSSEVDDYNIVVQGGFTPNNTETSNILQQIEAIPLSIGYDELEDITGFAVYESADLPENTLIGTEPYHLLDFDDNERVARYAKGLTQYE